MVSSNIEQVEKDLQETYYELTFQETMTVIELEYQLGLIKRLEKTLNKFKTRKTICNYTGLYYINNISNYIDEKIRRKTIQLVDEMVRYQKLQKDLLRLLKLRNQWFSKKCELNKIKRSLLVQKHKSKIYV